jgi:hypothetical protein
MHTALFYLLLDRHVTSNFINYNLKLMLLSRLIESPTKIAANEETSYSSIKNS